MGSPQAMTAAAPQTRVTGAERRLRRWPGLVASPGSPKWVAYAYLAPALVLVTLFVALPIAYTVYLSFFEWDGVSLATPVGLDNYREIVTDPGLVSLFLHSAVLVIFYAILPIAFGLLVAATFAQRRVRGMNWYRAALFLPQAMPLVVAAVAWQWIYAQSGAANQFLGLFGLDRQIAWLGEYDWALTAIGLVGTWLLTGLCTVLFISGVQGIDGALYEAARIDGANGWQELRYVTLPGVRREMTVALTLTVVAALRSFDLVYVMTKGGPGTSTSVPGYEIFQKAFTRQQVGSAAALAVVLTVIILVVTLVTGRLSKDAES